MRQSPTYFATFLQFVSLAIGFISFLNTSFSDEVLVSKLFSTFISLREVSLSFLISQASGQKMNNPIWGNHRHLPPSNSGTKHLIYLMCRSSGREGRGGGRAVKNLILYNQTKH